MVRHINAKAYVGADDIDGQFTVDLLEGADGLVGALNRRDGAAALGERHVLINLLVLETKRNGKKKAVYIELQGARITATQRQNVTPVVDLKKLYSVVHICVCFIQYIAE